VQILSIYVLPVSVDTPTKVHWP